MAEKPVLSEESKESLRRAREHIKSVRKTLNLSGAPCECCGRTNYADWPAMQMDKELGAIYAKMGRMAGENS